MYTFKYDIGLGFVDCNPIFSGAQLVKSRGGDDLRVRKNLTGDLIFFDDEFDSLKTLLDAGTVSVPFKIYADNIEQLLGEIGLLGKWDLQAKTANLQFSQNDVYTDILKNMDVEKPIRGATTITHDFTTQLRSRYIAVEIGISPITPTWDRYSANGVYPVNNWLNSVDYTPGQETNPGSQNWWGFDGTETIVKNSTQYFVALQASGPGTSNGIKEPPPGGDTYWMQVEPAPDRYSQEYADFEFNGSEWIPEATESTDAHYDEWQKGSASTQSTTAHIKGVSLFSILKSILGDIAPDIDVFFETSGANTGHCPYLENGFSEKLEKYIYSYENDAKISLQQIIEIFKNLHNCDWKIEGSIFVFRHPSERPVTIGTGDVYYLKTYKGDDWTRREVEFKVVDKVGKETWEQKESTVPDFDVMTINYDNVYEDKKEYSIPFWTDIKHALAEQEDTYIIAAPLGVLHNVTGILSGETVYNGGLCTSRCVFDHWKEGRPFSVYKDWTGVVALGLVQKRNNLILLKVPYTEVLLQDIENYLFHTDLSLVEIYEISVPLNGGIAQVKSVI